MCRMVKSDRNYFGSSRPFLADLVMKKINVKSLTVDKRKSYKRKLVFLLCGIMSRYGLF